MLLAKPLSICDTGPMPIVKTVAMWALAIFMVGVGTLHFVFISGLFEILGGLGLLIPETRPYAAWGLIALYVAVFPANIYMLTHNVSLNPKKPIPRWALWAWLPIQLVFIAWAYWFTK